MHWLMRHKMVGLFWKIGSGRFFHIPYVRFHARIFLRIIGIFTVSLYGSLPASVIRIGHLNTLINAFVKSWRQFPSNIWICIFGNQEIGFDTLDDQVVKSLLRFIQGNENQNFEEGDGSFVGKSDENFTTKREWNRLKKSNMREKMSVDLIIC